MKVEKDYIINKVVERLKENDARCKKIEDARGDFIAIFGYGNLTREEIVKQIADNELLCMFFEGSIREDKYNKSR